ncbi:hypothetical protein [Streptomyces noursei]|uniref:Uncharacterized protein n=1 Tax=Streptomyces noursei TaxID=1971 RepID=A0A2N8PAU0_STRNR|nr:hypothetical protein [Streptomyces noursei]PNE38133.1 hypothetical protein AOB60_28875 [Streptomyces noursei]
MASGGGHGAQLGDAELVTLAPVQALRGFTGEARGLRHAQTHLCRLFPARSERLTVAVERTHRRRASGRPSQSPSSPFSTAKKALNQFALFFGDGLNVR